MSSIQNTIIEEISLFQGVPSNKINLETRIVDAGFDSLEKIELIINIEDEFNITIEDEISEKFITVKDIVDYVTKVKENENVKSNSNTV